MREYLQTVVGEDVFSCPELTGSGLEAALMTYLCKYGAAGRQVCKHCSNVASSGLVTGQLQALDKHGSICLQLGKYNLRPGFTLLILKTDLRHQKLFWLLKELVLSM